MAVPILGQHSVTASSLDPLGNAKRSLEGRRTARQKDWVVGWWEHIWHEPIYITDKYHLKQVCQQYSKVIGREIIPKAFAKPKSQGKGIEWSF